MPRAVRDETAGDGFVLGARHAARADAEEHFSVAKRSAEVSPVSRYLGIDQAHALPPIRLEPGNLRRAKPKLDGEVVRDAPRNGDVLIRAVEMQRGSRRAR